MQKKQTENTGPYRPYLLNIVFSEKKGCQHIYRKTGQYGNKLLTEISQKWEIDLLLNIESEDVKQSIRTLRRQLEICTSGIFNIKFGLEEWQQTRDFFI